MTSKWFECDPAALGALKRVLREKYPTMHASVSEGIVTVKGTYAVEYDGHQIDRYSLQVMLPDNYPRSLPSVWETDGRIPRIADRHIFPATGALCLGVPVALWIAMNGDFRIGRIFDIPVRNYLIGNSMLEEGEAWPHGERAHGAEGILEFFLETIGTDDPVKVAELLRAMQRGGVRGHPCPCGSGLTIRKCHRGAIDKLCHVPADVLVASELFICNWIKHR